MNINQLKEVLSLIRESKCGYTPLIVGPAGIGKTEAVRQYAKSLGQSIRTIQLGQMSDAGDLIGLQYIKGENAKFTVPEWFPTEPNTIIFFDEINRAPKDLQQAVFQLISKDKEYNGRKLPDGCFIIAAMNPPSEEYDVTDLGDEAWRDRFCYIKLEPTASEWVDYANGAGIDGRLTSFIKANPEHLGIGENKFNLIDYVKPTPRSNEAASAVLAMAGNYSESAVSHALTGIIGPIPTAALLKYIKTQYTSIPMKKVLTKYSSVKEQVKAAATASDSRFDMLNKLNKELLKKASETAFEDKELVQLAEYIKDLPKDMAVGFLLTFLSQTPVLDKMIETKASCVEFFGDEKTSSIAEHFGPLTEDILKKHQEALEGT